MKLWVDDTQPAPEGWHHVRTAAGAIVLLDGGRVTHLSLGSGGMIVATCVEVGAYKGSVPYLEWNVHHDNCVVKGEMEAALRKADEYWGFKREDG